MRIVRAELYEMVIPYLQPFIISAGVMRERRSLVIVLQDESGNFGYGESPPDPLPFYSEETLSSARALLSELLLPRVVGAEFETPEAIDRTLREGVRGNPFARAGVETAGWDLFAARRKLGIGQLLADRLGHPAATEISSGVALGIPADRDPGTLRHRIAEALEHGYRRVKIKVAPGWDAVPVSAAREALAGSGVPLTVDANGAYEWPEHEPNLRALDDAELLYIEQPLAPDELVGHAALARLLRTPICLDETLRDARAARQIAALEGPRIWNIKVHRVGGLSEVCRIYRVADSYAAQLWAGTMPESGIGSQAALATAALPRCLYPSDVEPSARWFGPGNDVIEMTMNPEGQMSVPTSSISGLLNMARFKATSRLISAW